MMTRAPFGRIARRFALCACVAASACSSNGSVVPKVSPMMVSANFTMHWPSKTGQSNARHLRYISLSTQSVAVEVNNDPTLTTIVNKPISGAPISTIAIPAPAGADTFYFTTWDAPDAKGSQLGQVKVTQTITSGAANTISATVDGILAYIGISAAANQPFLEQTTDATGNPVYSIVGDQPATFTIVPEDADKNIIIPPGNAPTISMTSSDPAISVAAASGTPNQYTVKAIASTVPGAHPSLKVSGTDGIGTLVQGHYGLSELAAIYVGYQGPSGGSVVVYDQNGKVMKTSGAFGGIGDASGLAYDPNDGRIFVADHVLGAFNEFDTQGNTVSGFVPPSFPGAISVTYDGATKNAYLTSDSGNKVGVFSPAGAPVVVAGTFPGLDVPTGIAFNSDPANNQLYVANSGASATLTGYNGDGTAGNPATISQGGFTPYGVLFDIEVDAIFAIDAGATTATLMAFDTQSGGSLAQTSTDLNTPWALAPNPVNGEIYVTNNGNNTITAYSHFAPLTEDTSVTFTPPSGQTKPAGIAIVF